MLSFCFPKTYILCLGLHMYFGFHLTIHADINQGPPLFVVLRLPIADYWHQLLPFQDHLKIVQAHGLDHYYTRIRAGRFNVLLSVFTPSLLLLWFSSLSTDLFFLIDIL